VPDPHALLLFTLASLALIVVPGPAVMFIVTRSLEQGRSAGVVSMLGVEAGGLVHVFAATVGLSALVASSALAFSVVKYAGAAYLIWIGIGKLRRREEGELELPPPRPRSVLFREGLIVNVLNPKTAIFFLAFLPQFVDPDSAVAPQALLLGCIFVGVAVISDGFYAVLAGSLGDRLRRSAAVRRRLDRISGAVYIGLGATAALAGRHTSD
jgi:threonine/homoserine/homoserine lactone efflux protein